MGKKGVPEWLNSPLWSSNPSLITTTDDRLARYASSSSPETPKPQVPARAPPPPPPPLPERSVSETRAPEDDPRFSPEEISRGSQLSAELSKKVINLGELRRLASQGIPDGTGSRPIAWKDMEIIEQIDRDIKRTHPDMQFFSGDSSLAKSNQEALRNLLIIFAKLNPGIRYVQGMNELLAPLFYVFRNDLDENNAAYAEADTFFCFVELLSGFRDNFCKQLDNSGIGVRATFAKLSQLLKTHDEELWRHLEVTTKVNPQFYAFRWITLLLTQEFNLTAVLCIWDNLLSDPEGPRETLLRICCAMLILVRRHLLAGDFTSNLKLLQNYPTTNISHLLYVADKLRGPLAG